MTPSEDFSISVLHDDEEDARAEFILRRRRASSAGLGFGLSTSPAQNVAHPGMRAAAATTTHLPTRNELHADIGRSRSLSLTSDEGAGPRYYPRSHLEQEDMERRYLRELESDFHHTDDEAVIGVRNKVERAFINFRQVFLSSILFIIVGFGPFALLNGMWTEIAIFRFSHPEKDKIGASITAASNAGNGLSFLYISAFSSKFVPKPPDRIAVPIYIIIILITAVLMAQYSDATYKIAGQDVSIMVIITSFVSGFFGSVLLVVLYGFIGRYQGFATTTFSLGVGIIGVIVSFLGIGQRAGADPVFDVDVFYYIIFGFCFAALLAFLMLAFIPALSALHLDPAQFLQHYDVQEEDVFFSEKEIDAGRGETANGKEEEEVISSNAEHIVLRESQGAAKEEDFSLNLTINTSTPTLPTPTPTADDETAPLLGGESAGGKEVKSMRKFLKVAWAPCFLQFAKSFMVYFANPGLGTYLTKNALIFRWITFVAMSTNFIGRSMPLLMRGNPWILNGICSLMLGYEVVLALFGDNFPMYDNEF